MAFSTSLTPMAAQPRQAVGAHLGEHAGHVAQLVAVLQPRPLVAPVGQVFVVVVASIVAGVEEVLKVVETNGIELELFVLGE